MPEKVTMHFSSIADEGQGKDIIIPNSPVELFASIDNIESLGRLQGIPTDKNIFVYVRNVLKDKSRQQSAFYMHDCGTNKWKEVLLGSHSHENKELLDQIGNIDAETLPIGANKVLTLKRVDIDGSENTDGSYEYKLEWVDKPTEIPEIPENKLNTPVYLSVEDGKYVWKDQIIPAQTFQYKKAVVPMGNPEKELTIKDVKYDKHNEDTILLFDNGQLVDDFNAELVGSDLKITLPQDNPKLTFDEGENITLVIIKNGVKGFLDTVAAEYVTKAEAVDILSGKGISLYNYATKHDLDKKANKSHIHSQYSKVGHTHDDRYAMYDHSHDGVYLQASEAYSIIAGYLSNLIDDDGNIDIGPEDVNQAFKGAIDALDKKYHLLLDQKTDKNEFYIAINELRESFNTDEIKLSIDGNITEITLTDYLKEIELALNDSKAYTSKVKFDTMLKVNIGEGNSIGGINDGDIIYQDTTLQDFFERVFKKQVPPTLVQPEVSATIKAVNSRGNEILYEPGNKEVMFKIVPSFIQNDAGPLTSLKIIAKQFVDGELISTQEEDIIATESSYSIMKCDIYDGKSVQFDIVASYMDGEFKEDNFGKNNYHIPAGEVSYSQDIVGKRKSYYGHCAKNEDGSLNIRSAEIMNTPKSSCKLSVYPIYLKSINSYSNIVVFAFPADDNVQLEKIIYLNQSCDIYSIVERNRQNVPGDHGYKEIPYDIYCLESKVPLDDTLDFKLIIGDEYYGN